MKKLFSVPAIFIFLLLNIATNAQEQIEVFLIDSYVTPEQPYEFIVTFFTSDSATSKIIIDGKEELVVSDSLTDNHQAKFDFSDRKFDSTQVPFVIHVYDKFGNESISDQFDLALPTAALIASSDTPGFFSVCCLGGVIFGLPSPGVLISQNETYFTLSKEIPVFSFYSGGFNYPISYFSIEYGYAFNAPIEHSLRLGYKYIWQPGVIEYIAPGINLVTDFNGFNGGSPEISIGLFKIYNVFTLYSKYRYNFQPGKSENYFHEISIGLYSNVFSINL